MRKLCSRDLRGAKRRSRTEIALHVLVSDLLCMMVQPAPTAFHQARGVLPLFPPNWQVQLASFLLPPSGLLMRRLALLPASARPWHQRKRCRESVENASSNWRVLRQSRWLFFRRRCLEQRLPRTRRNRLSGEEEGLPLRVVFLGLSWRIPLEPSASGAARAAVLL